MRREELVAGAKEVIPILDVARAFFATYTRTSRDVAATAPETLEKYYIVRRGIERLSDSGKLVLEQLKFDKALLEVATWTAGGTGKELEAGRELYTKIRTALFGLRNVLPLLTETDAHKVRQAIEADKVSHLGFLQVTVIEEGNSVSTPERLCEALTAIADLYEVAAQLVQTSTPLSVVGCDSGSDKSFDFVGAGKALESVKDIILSLWDKVVYYKQNRTSRNIDLLVQGLPVLTQIDELRAAETISPELAEQMKRSVVKGCTKFLDAGCTIPEISDNASVSPRALLQPEPKMLSADNPKPPDPDATPPEGLGEDEDIDETDEGVISE